MIISTSKIQVDPKLVNIYAIILFPRPYSKFEFGLNVLPYYKVCFRPLDALIRSTVKPQWYVNLPK